MVAPLFCNYGMALTERNLERERESMLLTQKVLFVLLSLFCVVTFCFAKESTGIFKSKKCRKNL